MRPPKTFQTDRLQLRPPRQEDAAAIFEEYTSRKAPTRWMDWPRHRDVSETLIHARRNERCWTSTDSTAFSWAVENKVTGEFMGMVELRLHLPSSPVDSFLREHEI